MYIAYSALRTTNNKATNQYELSELQLRYQAYQYACLKYSNEIEKIQQYLPGWVPSRPTL